MAPGIGLLELSKAAREERLRRELAQQEEEEERLEKIIKTKQDEEDRRLEEKKNAEAEAKAAWLAHTTTTCGVCHIVQELAPEDYTTRRRVVRLACGHELCLPCGFGVWRGKGNSNPIIRDCPLFHRMNLLLTLSTS